MVFGAVMKAIFPNPTDSAGPALIIGNVIHLVVARALPGLLGIALPSAGADAERCLAYFLSKVLGPLSLFSFGMFEYQAISRIPEGGQPWTTATVTDDDNPPFAVKVARCAQNSFEQSFVSLCVNGALALSLGAGNAVGADVRLPVTNLWLYILCRILYLQGYTTHPMFRLLPLVAGGFWVNGGYALYATLRQVGFADTAMLWHGCTIGVPVAVLMAVVTVIGQAKKKKK